MPMFQPSKRDGVVGYEGGGDGLILDQETAVKDGVLGGVVGDAGGDKLVLNKMIEELDLSEVPSVFICPISLEPISSLLGPFTSHAVGSEAIGILVNLTLDSESKTNLMQPARFH